MSTTPEIADIESSHQPSAHPTRRQKNELLEMHGSSRFLITRLARYATTGWIAFFLSLSLFIFYVAVDKLVPVPVIAVNGNGQILGKIEYLNPTTRTDDEVIAGAKYFLDRFLSLNSSTIFNDNAAALTMMEEDLRNRKIEELKATNYLIRAENARAHSFNDFDKTDGAIIIARRDLLRSVRLKGNLVITAVDGQTLEKPFDITLDLRIVARNTFVTTGLSVVDIRNN